MMVPVRDTRVCWEWDLSPQQECNVPAMEHFNINHQLLDTESQNLSPSSPSEYNFKMCYIYRKQSYIQTHFYIIEWLISLILLSTIISPHNNSYIPENFSLISAQKDQGSITILPNFSELLFLTFSVLSVCVTTIPGHTLLFKCICHSLISLIRYYWLDKYFSWFKWSKLWHQCLDSVTCMSKI